MMKKKVAAILTAGAMALGMVACGSGSGSSSSGSASKKSGVEDGVLSVAMECSYAPYNWAQPNDDNDAVPIVDSDQYANGYDIMMAKKDLQGQRMETRSPSARLGFTYSCSPVRNC
jgi:putative lysine transport system substrate-binding protein